MYSIGWKSTFQNGKQYGAWLDINKQDLAESIDILLKQINESARELNTDFDNFTLYFKPLGKDPLNNEDE